MDSRSHSLDQAIYRLATAEDFKALYHIWFQDHIIPFMTFERMDEEEFKIIFETLIRTSEVYVIEYQGQVVATRRIMYNSGEHAHSVELGSFGVDKNHLGKGYGIGFYRFLIEKLKTERPEIKRVEIGQETDNDVAFNLANKMGFKSEVILPDWIRRKTGPEQYTNKWNMGARFMACILDTDLEKKSVAHVNEYTPKMPSLKSDPAVMREIKIETDAEGKQATCYYKGNKIGSCQFTQGVRRFDHVRFWQIQLEPSCDMQAMEMFLRQLACDAAQECKKIEVFVSDKDSAALVENLGFHCRGKKIGSCKIGDDYYDELGVDLSFFDIQDAKELAGIYAHDYDAKRASSALTTCLAHIRAAQSEEMIDEYAALYLQNMAFQMVREGLGELAIQRYGQKNQEAKPWQALIEALTLETLKQDFIHLDKLTTQSYQAELGVESSLKFKLN